MSPYVSWQVDLLNLDNVYPFGIKQKISKSIIKTSFATAQISSRFYFIQFFQKNHTKCFIMSIDRLTIHIPWMNHSVKVLYQVLGSTQLKNFWSCLHITTFRLAISLSSLLFFISQTHAS